MNDFDIRLGIAEEAARHLPPDDPRARHALTVLARYQRGEATMRQLVHAGEACRQGLRAYAKQGKLERNASARARYKTYCLALFASYDLVDRVLDDRDAPPPEAEPLLLRILRFLFSWMWPVPTPELPQPTPYRTSGRRAA